MNKVRCSVCKRYLDRADAFYRNNLITICSETCFADRPVSPSSSGGGRKQRRFVSTPRTRSARVSERASIISGRRLRQRVLGRDVWRCRVCSTGQNLHVHHILYRSQGGADMERNMITLCFRCHDLMHSDKKRWMPVLVETQRLYYEHELLLPVLEVERLMNDYDKPVP